MSSPPSSTESSLTLFANEPDLAGLLAALRQAQGFALFFARCDAPIYRRRLVSALKSRLARPIVEIDLHCDGQADFRTQIGTALEYAFPQAVVFLYGLEHCLPAEDTERQREALQALNDWPGFQNSWPRPFVFWLPEEALSLLMRAAPDLDNRTCGVYTFDLAEAARREAIRTGAMDLGNVASVQSLSLEEKQRWAGVVDALITDAKDTPSADRQSVSRLLRQSAILAQELADYERAKTTLEYALRIDEITFGPAHPDVATDRRALGDVLQELGDLKGAMAHYERALQIDEAACGPQHPSVARDLNSLGRALRALEDLPAAKHAFERAIRIGEAVYGAAHPEMAGYINNLGGVLHDLGDLQGARAHYQRALRIDEAVFGRTHPRVAGRLNNLGLVLHDLGDLPAAKNAFERALRIDEVAYGVEHPEVATDVNNLGGVLQELGDLQGALRQYERALAIFQRYFGEDHPNTRTALRNRVSVQSQRSRHSSESSE